MGDEQANVGAWLDEGELLRLILKHTPDPILIKTADSRLIEVNEALLRHAGRTREEVVGRFESDLKGLDPVEMSQCIDDARRVAHGTEPKIVVERATNPQTGEVRIFRSVKAPARDRNGTPLVVIAAQDITDLETTRARLIDREAVMRATLDAVASGTWEFDPSTGQLRNDEAWLEIFGVDPETHDGSVATFSRLLHPEDREAVFAKVSACESGEADGYVSEHRMLRTDGRTIWVRDAGQVVDRDANGRALRMVGAVVDITHLKDQQAELDRRRLEAEAAVNAKARFLANMSHELRTPMNGVLGMLDHLLETSLDPDQRELSEVARTSALGLLGILNDILDTSKLEAGAIELESVPVELDALLREVESMFAPQASKMGLELTVQRAPQLPPTVLGDPTRLRQVLVNLVGNALKFTERGRVAARLSASEGKLHCEVRDTGVGIPEDAQHRLFERFTQADASTTRRFGGTGLGLAISHQLVELMGGELRVDSTVGKGSAFSFDLPLRATTASAGQGDGSPLPELPSLRILVAEDVVVNQMVVRRLLERMGHAVHIVNDGRAAVAAVEAEAFDVVLMDINMPEMDGLEATRTIRDRGDDKARVPIVALTANAMDGDRERYLEMGMDAYVAKPVRRPQLLHAMAKATGQQG